METQDSDFDFLGKGIYTINAAARLVNVHPTNARRWSVGRKYRRPDGQQDFQGALLFSPAHKKGDNYYLTFQQIVEIRVIAQFMKKGVDTKVIRAAAEKAASDYNTPHPFAVEGFFETDGKALFTTATKRVHGPKISGRVMHNIVNGQGVMEEIVRTYLKDIDFKRAQAIRYWPLGRAKGIVIDPVRSFGRPIDSKSGITTDVLYNMSKSGMSNSQVADWYSVRPSTVNTAIEYEESLLLAA